MVGRGILNQGPNISFQVALVPTASQWGQSPELIGEARIIGQDQWTNEILDAIAPAVDITLPDDQAVGAGKGIVQ